MLIWKWCSGKFLTRTLGIRIHEYRLCFLVAIFEGIPHWYSGNQEHSQTILICIHIVWNVLLAQGKQIKLTVFFLPKKKLLKTIKLYVLHVEFAWNTSLKIKWYTSHLDHELQWPILKTWSYHGKFTFSDTKISFTCEVLPINLNNRI